MTPRTHAVVVLLALCFIASASAVSVYSIEVFFQDAVTEITTTQALDANAAFLAKDRRILQRLSDLEEDIEKMGLAGLRTVRIADGLIAAQSFYELERSLVEGEKKEDFTDTSRKILEMEEIKDLAYESKDAVFALEVHMEDVKNKINWAPVDALLKTAKKEMNDERFEKAIETAAIGENKIIELQSLDTKARAAAEAATANLAHFLDVNKFNILAIVAVVIVVFLVFQNRLRHYLARTRIRALELEKETLRNEIRRAQEEFFVKASIPESMYKIRIRVFSAMIRTTTRKIAVAYESEKKSELSGFFKRPIETRKDSKSEPKGVGL